MLKMGIEFFLGGDNFFWGKKESRYRMDGTD